MIKIRELTQTCEACPSQWEGTTTKSEYIYIRYRWGWLSVSVDRKVIFERQLGDKMGGLLTHEGLREATQDIIDWGYADNSESFYELVETNDPDTYQIYDNSEYVDTVILATVRINPELDEKTKKTLIKALKNLKYQE